MTSDELAHRVDELERQVGGLLSVVTALVEKLGGPDAVAVMDALRFNDQSMLDAANERMRARRDAADGEGGL